MTQNQQVLEHLRECGAITALEAVREYGILRLAARINELQRQGFVIGTQMIDVQRRDKTSVRVAQYRLLQEAR